MKKIRLASLAAILCVVIGCASVVMAEEHTHSFGEWNVKTAATCVAEGTKVRICSDCGKVESEAIPATGDHAWTEIPAKDPTYTEAGNTAGKKCNVCGLTEGAESIPALEPTEKPTEEPTEEPAEEPAEEPTTEPTEKPATKPTEKPATKPTEKPSDDVKNDDVPKTGDNGISYVVIISAMALSVAYLFFRRFSCEK